MKSRAHYAEWVVSAVLLIFSASAWHYNSVDSLRTKQYEQNAVRVYSQAITLGREIDRKKTAPIQKAIRVGTTTAVLLSAMRRQGAASGIMVDRAEINSIRVNGNNWQYLNKMASKSKFDGLKRIQVHIEGQWATLNGLISFLSVIDGYPAQIHQIDVSDGYYKVMVNVYGY